MNTSKSATVFHLDQEHKGVRYAVILILLVSFVVAFWATNAAVRALLPEINTTAILSCLAAIPVSLTISAVGEWFLKRSWHSGRVLRMEPDGLVLSIPQQADIYIDRHKIINTLWWQISLSGYARGGRERRIPASWYVMAGQLLQDDARIIIYCYAPPQRRRKWSDRFEFEKLKPDDVYNTSFSARLGSPNRPEIPPDVIAGRQGRYWLAERNRWRDGFEMTPADFEQFLEQARPMEA